MREYGSGKDFRDDGERWEKWSQMVGMIYGQEGQLNQYLIMFLNFKFLYQENGLLFRVVGIVQNSFQKINSFLDFCFMNIYIFIRGSISLEKEELQRIRGWFFVFFVMKLDYKFLVNSGIQNELFCGVIRLFRGILYQCFIVWFIFLRYKFLQV